MKKTRGKLLLERVQQAKQKQTDKSFDKIVGKKKNKARFEKVNFNG